MPHSTARSSRRDVLNEESNLTATKSTDTWVKELNAARVPCEPIYSFDQMFDDDQVKHLGIAQDVPMRRTARSAWSASQ